MSTKRKNRKHSLSEKLKVVELYQEGYGCTTISRKLDISKSLVKHWIGVFRNHGVLSLERQVHNQLSAELKQRVVKDVLENSLSFDTVALKYHISIYAVYSWTQKVKLQLMFLYI